jgi:two-component system OmpR family response regulator
MLPGKDGFVVSKDLKSGFNGPILMLTAKGTDFDQVLGLEVGADDYVIKPVEPRVLLARNSDLLRRGQLSGEANELTELTFGNLYIKRCSRQVTLNEENVDLTSQ